VSVSGHIHLPLLALFVRCITFHCLSTLSLNRQRTHAIAFVQIVPLYLVVEKVGERQTPKRQRSTSHSFFLTHLLPKKKANHYWNHGTPRNRYLQGMLLRVSRIIVYLFTFGRLRSSCWFASLVLP
jgi:hypothetical protein